MEDSKEFDALRRRKRELIATIRRNLTKWSESYLAFCNYENDFKSAGQDNNARMQYKIEVDKIDTLYKETVMRYERELGQVEREIRSYYESKSR